MKYFMPPTIALGLCLVWILVLAIPGWLLGFLILFGGGLVVLSWLAIRIVIAFAIYVVRHGSRSPSPSALVFRWVMCVVVLASTAALALLVSYPSPPDAPATMAARGVDFALYRQELDTMVRQQHLAGQRPAVAVFAVDGFISSVHGIAYDESGEIALPAGAQSSRWLTAVAGTELGAGTWTAARMYGNYFWWDSE